MSFTSVAVVFVRHAVCMQGSKAFQLLTIWLGCVSHTGKGRLSKKGRGGEMAAFGVKQQAECRCCCLAEGAGASDLSGLGVG